MSSNRDSRRQARINRMIEAHIEIYHKEVFVPILQGVVDGFTSVLVENGLIGASPEAEVEVGGQDEVADALV